MSLADRLPGRSQRESCRLRLLKWLALSDRMPGHEQYDDIRQVGDTLTNFRRVLKEAGFSREEPSVLGVISRPFSVTTSSWLRSYGERR